MAETTRDAEPARFGELLRRYRVAAGLSQEALAERAGVSVRAISDLERGARRHPYRETVGQLAAALGLHGSERAALQEAARGHRAPRAEPVRSGPESRTHAALLATKLAPPPLRSSLIARPHLVARLSAGLQGPLTLLSAPPGCGKTTLLGLWRAGNRLPLAWVSLDPGDNDPVRFWSYALAALERALPGAGAPALSLLQSRTMRRGPAVLVDAALTAMVNALNAATTDVVLVLDDYHEVTAPEVHHSLAFLLDYQPARLHLLVSTRADPPLPLARLRARSALVELRASDLRFTAQETAAFLGDAMGLPLDTAAVEALEARTEGWIAGLQLAALSLQGRPPDDVAQAISAFAGSHRYIVDYLAEEVLLRQPDVVQRFLLRTCILDRLSAPLCAAVVGDDDAVVQAQERLHDLERGNVFVVALDDERHWYRYHQLFADALRQRLHADSGGESVATLHERAAGWFEREGLLHEAISHALAASAAERAAGLIERIGLPLLLQGEVQTLRAWLDALPESSWRARPRLCILQAWLILDLHTAEAVAGYVNAAEEALQRLPPAHDRREIEGEVAATKAIVAALGAEPARVITEAEVALNTLSHDNTLMRSLAYATLAAAFIGQGDLPRAEEILSGAAIAARDAGNVTLVLAMTEDLTYVQRVRGRLRLAVATCRQALAWSEAHGGPAPFAAGVHLSLADLLIEWNELGEAARYAQDALALAMPLAFLSGQFAGQVVLARLRRAQGDLEGALAALAAARAVVQPHIEVSGMAPLAAILDACEAQVWLAQGNLPAALDWLRRPHQEMDTVLLQMSPQFTALVYEHVAVAPAQTLIAQGRASGDPAPLREALALLAGQRAEAERSGLPWPRIKACTLQALASWELGEHAQSLGMLRAALALAEPEGYVRVFADEGLPMALLLRALCAAPQADPAVSLEYIQTVLDACNQDVL